MAKVDVQYSCGCGFKTHDQAVAYSHCDDLCHAVTVQGIIAPETEKIAKEHKTEDKPVPRLEELKRLRMKLTGVKP